MCKITISTFHYYAQGVIGVIIFAHVSPGAEPHSGLGGPWPLQKKKKNFPLDYEEKIIRPP